RSSFPTPTASRYSQTFPRNASDTAGYSLLGHLLGRTSSTWRASQSVIHKIDIFSCTLRYKQLGGHFLFTSECFGPATLDAVHWSENRIDCFAETYHEQQLL